MIEWFVHLFPNTYQGAANCLVCAMLIVFAFFGILCGTILLLCRGAEKKEEKKAKQLPSYIRAYDKHGNRIK